MAKRLIDDNINDEERLLWRGGFSAKSMLSAWLGAALITTILLVAVSRIPELREIRLVGWTMYGIIALIWFGLFCLVVYRKLAQHFEITNQRLRHRRGILLRQTNRIEMIDIDDVSYRQGPLQALMDVGTILLRSSDTSLPRLVMTGIGNVSNVASLIDDARREERHKRGWHSENI